MVVIAKDITQTTHRAHKAVISRIREGPIQYLPNTRNEKGPCKPENPYMSLYTGEAPITPAMGIASPHGLTVAAVKSSWAPFWKTQSRL